MNTAAANSDPQPVASQQCLSGAAQLQKWPSVKRELRTVTSVASTLRCDTRTDQTSGTDISEVSVLGRRKY